MKNIVKLSLLSLIVLSATLFNPQNSFSQVTDSENISDQNIAYWFYINLKIITDPQTKLKRYEIRRLGDQISAGSIKEYDIKLWQSLSKGSRMPIGPFYNYDEANQAKLFYNVGANEKQDSLFNNERQIFWFILHVNRRERSGSFELVRKPGAIASGDYEEFKSFLETNLTGQVLTIGPFWDQPEAEEAKRRYRLH